MQGIENVFNSFTSIGVIIKIIIETKILLISIDAKILHVYTIKSEVTITKVMSAKKISSKICESMFETVVKNLIHAK